MSTSVRPSGAILGLGYLGVTAPDLDEWTVFATDLLGLEPVPAQLADDSARFRLDSWAWRISVSEGDGGLAFAGWQVGDESSLQFVCDRLTEAGFDVRRDERLAARRDVAGLAYCDDPSGNRLEFFYGPRLATKPFLSPVGARFVTGDQGLGHIVLAAEDTADMIRFYRDDLQFAISDTMEIGPIALSFMHVNPRHHSLAVAQIPGDPGSLSHLMIEVDELDAVGRALDRVEAGAASLTRTLGRHSNDQMLSFYVRSPAGFDVEYGCGGLRIDPDHWAEVTHDGPSTWGHRSLVSYG